MYKITFLLIAVVVLFASCAKDQSSLLDPATSVLTDKEVFSDARYADQFLTDIYGWLLPVYATTGNAGTRWGGDVLLEATTDNGSSNTGSTLSFRTFNTGAWTAATGGMFYSTDWQTNFRAIRAINLYLKNIDNVPLDAEYNFTEERRANRKAEAKFLMAWYYAELNKQFGGLPLIKEPLDVSSDMTNIPRATFDETVAFIVSLCDEAAAALPLAYTADEWGRITKGAAMALKARTLLYAASPLWNNSAKPADSPFRGKYDANKWKLAAEACGAVITLDGGNRYRLNPDISNMFLIYQTENPEWIFEHRQRPQAYMTYISIPTKVWTAPGPTKNGCNQVTYNMVKEYEVLKNGVAYSIDDPASGYNPNDPFKNRDPRFYRDCMFNGFKYQGKTAAFGVNGPGATKTLMNPIEVSSYYTYVFSIKFADLTITSAASNVDGRNPAYTQNHGSNYPYIRYAEILLDYAEAMNEAYGPDVDPLGVGKTALQAVNEVRTRAAYQARQEYMGYTGAMPPIPSGLSKDVMREKIRHERRVELTFEEHRFWDCRRWKIVPDEEIKAQIPTWAADGSVTYPIVTIETRPWDNRMFRMPIPENETFSDPALKQNPGYNRSEEATE